MEHIPFLVVHGEWFWAVPFGGAIALTLAWTLLAPRLFSRIRARHQLARLGEPKPLEVATEGDDITLSGTLIVHGEATTRFEDKSKAAATTAAPVRPSDVLGALAISRSADDLVLVVGGTAGKGGVEVGIEGALEVLCGSREVYPGQKFGSLGGKTKSELFGVDDETLEALSKYRVAFRSLMSGDAVRLKGYLRRSATPTQADTYRAPSDRWVLAAQPNLDPNEAARWPIAAAYEGHTKVTIPKGWRLLRKILIIVALWSVFFVGSSLYALGAGNSFAAGPREPIGSQLVGTCREQPITPWTHVSFALPFAYREKLSNLNWALGERCFWDRESVEQIGELRLLRGMPGHAALAFASHGELRRGEELALSLGPDDRDALPPLYLLGRWQEASKRSTEARMYAEGWGYEPDHLVMVQLFAKQRAKSIEMARLLANRRSYVSYERVEQRPPHDDSVGESWSMLCWADAQAALDGSGEARARLQQRVNTGTHLTLCPEIMLDILEGRNRQKIIEHVEARGMRANWEALLLLAESDPTELDSHSIWSDRYAIALGRTPRYWLAGGRPNFYSGLEVAALEALEARGSPLEMRFTGIALRAELNARAAAFEQSLGQYEDARQHAIAVFRDLDRLGEVARMPHSEGTLMQKALARLAAIELIGGLEDEATATLARLRREPPDDQARRLLLGELTDLEVFLERGEVTPGFMHNYGFADTVSAWILAGAGNGAAIRRAFGGNRAPFRTTRRPFWLARVETGRRELAEQLRWSSRWWTYDRLALDVLMLHAWDLEAARALEDEAWEAEVRPVYERFREAILRRDVTWMQRLTESEPR